MLVAAIQWLLLKHNDPEQNESRVTNMSCLEQIYYLLEIFGIPEFDVSVHWHLRIYLDMI
jgi:hypothetical protein